MFCQTSFSRASMWSGMLWGKEGSGGFFELECEFEWVCEEPWGVLVLDFGRGISGGLPWVLPLLRSSDFLR